jgi:DNA-binding LacI/PurR family transcriptional regulator
LIEEAQATGLPVVLVGRQTKDIRLSAVGRDEEGIAHVATSHLLNLGHRGIAFIGGEEDYSYTLSRLVGYRQALREAGIEPLARWVALGEGRVAAKSILKKAPDITATFFVNDAYAMEGLPVFASAGKRIPTDLSVISFDDSDEAREYVPPLTSVTYPRFLEGYWALRLLIEQIRQPLIIGQQVVFQASLIHRASCAPPP